MSEKRKTIVLKSMDIKAVQLADNDFYLHVELASGSLDGQPFAMHQCLPNGGWVFCYNGIKLEVSMSALLSSVMEKIAELDNEGGISSCALQ